MTKRGKRIKIRVTTDENTTSKGRKREDVKCLSGNGSLHVKTGSKDSRRRRIIEDAKEHLERELHRRFIRGGVREI